MSAAEVRDSVAARVASPLPSIGSGDTAERWTTLADWARSGSVSVARLAEAHIDAMAILREAGVPPFAGIYGVWASQGSAELVVDRGTMTVTGTKPFCSGLGIADRALVTVIDSSGDQLLVDVAVGAKPGVDHDLTGWNTDALAATATGSVQFDGQSIDRIVGDSGWYLERPGFWHGAIGPAACWAGAALGLVDDARSRSTDSEIDRVVLGELAAEEHLLTALLRDAGASADDAVDDRVVAQRTAYCVRHLVERSAQRISDTFSRHVGPRPFVSDPAIAQRLTDLHLYCRQHHGLRDLVALGSMEDS